MGGTPQTWDAQRLAHRRAVEALRSGVPCADAVTALGSGQSEIEDRFVRLLDAVGESDGHHRDRASLLLAGGFGEGKSHLLTHLGHLAGLEGFVVSPVVVSKETPLHDPAKVFRSAVESAVAPGGVRDVVAEAAAALDPESDTYAALLRWMRGPGSDLNARFDATLFLHARLRSEASGADEEFVDTIVRFWSGDPLPMPDLRRQLKAVGAGKSYTFAPIKARELARQRLRFLPRLLRAAGHAGWVVLFDEVELIGRSSRARTTGRWSPAGLRDKQTPEFDELATLAQAGMRHIERDALALVPPDAEELDRAYKTLRRLHGAAYAWEAPDVAGLERLGATRMRQYVRAWINEWDLVRLDPAYRPATEVLDVASDYREQDGLEDSDDDG